QGVCHAVDVLAGHAKRLRYFDCKRTDVFATAVLRNCKNSTEAVAAIEERSGFSITLLSDQDEAHLGFVGAISDKPIEEGTLVDLGGGSTELISIREGIDHNNTSIGQGSLSSFANFVAGILPDRHEMRTIERAFESRLSELPDISHYASHTLYGIGGSVRAATKLYAEAFGNGNRPDTLTLDDVDAIIDLYHQDTNAFAHTALKAVPDRVHTLLPGCLIIRRLMTEFGSQTLSICKKGVREGYLIERMLLSKATTINGTEESATRKDTDHVG
ncbi:MAG: exopolyphosphatase, partial [Raoultibacter sp.]